MFFCVIKTIKSNNSMINSFLSTSSPIHSMEPINKIYRHFYTDRFNFSLPRQHQSLESLLNLIKFYFLMAFRKQKIFSKEYSV
ncbi:hypothetical protein M153_356000145 [Pseudoloma neurophilia]|uniref:Uncharacterized protein n=1 Tax=Pseudoloma neurophilia TaxID=146866 RepID=A0A0R0LYG7_9MICR|nr:hypothetical protein M153_356000145 [Pseudoloma neurophilia]